MYSAFGYLHARLAQLLEILGVVTPVGFVIHPGRPRLPQPPEHLLGANALQGRRDGGHRRGRRTATGDGSKRERDPRGRRVTRPPLIQARRSLCPLRARPVLRQLMYAPALRSRQRW